MHNDNPLFQRVSGLVLALVLVTSVLFNLQPEREAVQKPGKPQKSIRITQAGLGDFSLREELLAPLKNDNLEYTAMLVTQGKKIPLSGNLQQLKNLYNGLLNAKQRKIRIAHWGDSIILGDIISENLRENFQKQYGGSGCGFVSINCDDFGMRNTTVVSFSNDWKESSIVKRNPDKLPLGINGAVYQPSQGSWVKYEIGKTSKTMRSFNQIKLYYASAPGGGNVQFSFSNGSSQNVKLETGNSLKEVSINAPSGSNFVKLTFFSCTGGYFYGVSFENGEGVYLDNLPIRGNSGVSLTDIPASRLKEFNNLMNYKLIMINFGVNVVTAEHTNYMWYEARMEKVINYLKEALPQASFLLISVSDKAIKKGTRFTTDPGIPILLKSQQSIADKNGIAFWNAFEAMGGMNTIVDWVEANPPLANKDYCHLRPEGGKIMADLLFDAITKEMKK